MKGIPVDSGKRPWNEDQFLLQQLLWRHVFSDLQPYVCMFEECKAGLFLTRHEWIKHEIDIHRRQWKCIRCDEFKKQHVRESDMVTHLRQSHSDNITEEQASIILTVCQEPQTTFDSSECPLCSEWNPTSTDVGNAKDFFRHLAQHQQQLALEALPLYIEGLEIEDPKTSTSDSESGSNSEEEVPIDQGETEDQNQAHEQGHLFGVTLESLFARDGSEVNAVILKCIEAVEIYGLSQKNIYQRSGSADVIQTLRNEFERDTRSPAVDFSNPYNFSYNIDNIAGLLGRFLQELPEPLMTKDKYALFIEATKEEDEEVGRERLHSIINMLPTAHYATLRAIVFHLRRVMENYTINKMDPWTLSKIFGPLLFGVDSGVSESDLPRQIKAMKTILDCASDMFDEE
ncbi:hypothetical protein ACHAP7_005666 [Fusarium lateritium]